MIVDAHTHLFSRVFFEALAGLSPLPGTVDERLARVAREAGIELPDAHLGAHVGRWLAELDAAGVERCVVFASVPAEADAVAAAVRTAPDRLAGYAQVDPGAADAVSATEAHFVERGFHGALLFPAMHRFPMGGKAARAVLDVVAAHRGIVVVHCGILQVKLRDLLGLPRPYDLAFANPLDLVPVANAYPDARFVVPHFGAGFFREVLMLGAQCENVLVDTSSSNSWMATQAQRISLAEVFRRTLDVYGPARVLFGTDSSTFPRGWRSDLLDAQRAALAEAGASAAEQAQVLGGNAAALLARVGR